MSLEVKGESEGNVEEYLKNYINVNDRRRRCHVPTLYNEILILKH